jgi:hypothetical protein
MMICKAFDMELATFETFDEMMEVGATVLRKNNLFGAWTHVGGMSPDLRNPSTWNWMNSNKRIFYGLPWHPSEPNGAGNE